MSMLDTSLAETPYDSRVLSGPFDAVARLRGRLPDWLRGRLLRTAPSLFEFDGWQAHHWFDALGMLYAFEIEAADRVSFMQRLLESDIAAATRRHDRRYAMFGTPTCKPWWRRIMQPLGPTTDNANVHIVPMGDEWIAMTETERQLSIDPETLRTRGHVRYDDRLPRAMSMTAHPLVDLERNLVVNVGTTLGRTSQWMVYDHAPNARTRRVIGRVALKRAPYLHSFGMTAHEVVLIAHPYDINPLQMLWSSRPFMDHFRWHPESGTRLITVNRATGATREHEIEPMFVFHTVNTFRMGDNVVLDVLAYPDASILDKAMRTESMQREVPDLRATLTRIFLPSSGPARSEPLCDVGFEFPAISYRQRAGRRHGVVFGSSITPAGRSATSTIVRIDVDIGRVSQHVDGSFVFGEPMFVGAPHASREDDGVLLSVGSDPKAGCAKLVVLAADSLALIAEAIVDVPLPLGYHGSFQRAA